MDRPSAGLGLACVPQAAHLPPAVNFQAIARREHDVLNLSLVMATPPAPPGGAQLRRRAGTR